MGAIKHWNFPCSRTTNETFKWSYDPRSYERNFYNCLKKPEKFRTSTGFEPVNPRYRCDTLTNWSMKPLTLGAGHLWVPMFPWGTYHFIVKWNLNIQSESPQKLSYPVNSELCGVKFIQPTQHHNLLQLTTMNCSLFSGNPWSGAFCAIFNISKLSWLFSSNLLHISLPILKF